MPSIKLENFSGTIPRTGPTQLPDNAAQVARNVRLTLIRIFVFITPEMGSLKKLTGI